MYSSDMLASSLRTRFQEFTDCHVRSFSQEAVSQLVSFFTRDLLQKNHLIQTATDLDSLELCSYSPQLEMEECKDALCLFFARYKRVYNQQLRVVSRVLTESGVKRQVLGVFIPKDDSLKGNEEDFESFLAAQHFDFTVQVKERLESIRQKIQEIRECKAKKMLSTVKNLKPLVISLGEQLVADCNALVSSIEEHLITEIRTNNFDRLIELLDSVLEQKLVSQPDIELAFTKSLEELWLYIQSVEAFLLVDLGKDQEAGKKQLEDLAQKGCTFAMMQVAKDALTKEEKISEPILQYLLEVFERGEEESFDVQCFLELTDADYPSSYQEKSISFLKDIAATGHGEAMAWLGIHHLDGSLVEQSYFKAYFCLMEGAEAGDGLALLKLAECYCQGFAVEQDFEKAFECLERGSIRQDKRCTYEMSVFLEKGIGTEKDIVRALRYRDLLPEGERIEYISIDLEQEKLRLAAKTGSSADCFAYAHYVDTENANYPLARVWYEKAAMHKDVKAMFRLGELLEEGVGGEKDLKRALRYYLLSAREGHSKAIEKVGILLAFTKEVQNPRRAEDYLCRAAEAGSAVAQFYYGRYLEEIKKNTTKARVWLRKAVEQNHTEAMFFLASLLEKEEENREEAIHLYEKTSSRGHLMSLLNLGELLLEKDKEKGIGYIREAAEKGLSQAQVVYATTLKNDGKNAEAHTWLQKAVEQGEKTALCFMAALHLSGDGCEKNVEKADALLKQASRLIKVPFTELFHKKVIEDLKMYNRILFTEE